MTKPKRAEGPGRGVGGGRPGKLTAAARSGIARRLAAGETIPLAAASAGIGARTLERWLAEGRIAQDLANAGKPIPAKSQPFVQLLVAIEQAELELTDDTREQIAGRMLATGSEVPAAAASVGVSTRALERWLELGRQARERRRAGSPPGAADLVYLALLDDIDQAHGAAEVGALGTIQKAMLNQDWRAAAWFLERMWPERYGKRQGRPSGIPQEIRDELEQLRAMKAQAPTESRLETLRARVARRTA